MQNVNGIYGESKDFIDQDFGEPNKEKNSLTGIKWLLNYETIAKS